MDYMLPVRLNDDNWIGLIFRNNELISICIDCDDVENKAKLFDITFDKNMYEWMKNDIQRLKIIKPKLQIKNMCTKKKKYQNKKQMYEGVVVRYIEESKYGFIWSDVLRQNLFFMETDFKSNKHRKFIQIKRGIKVRFQIAKHLYNWQNEMKAINIDCI